MRERAIKEGATKERAMKLRVPEHIQRIAPYVPGKPIEELEREYGIRDSIKLASNENPLGPSPGAVAAIQKAVANLHRYPDGGGYVLVRRLGQHLNVRPDQIVLGNGSDDIISMLSRVFLGPGDEVMMPKSAFLMYEIMAHCDGGACVHVPLKELGIDLAAMAERLTPETQIIFLTHPNNPTGAPLYREEFEAFLDRVPRDVIVVVDEAYIEFLRAENCVNGLDYIDGEKPVVVLRTFSKAYGLAGLRIGYGVMPARVAEVLNRIRQPFNTSLLAQAGAAAALDDVEFLEKTVRLVHEGLDYLHEKLSRLGLKSYPSQANFLMFRSPMPADDLFEAMLRKGVIVRSMRSYGFLDHIRVNVGLPEENRRFIRTLEEILR